MKTAGVVWRAEAPGPIDGLGCPGARPSARKPADGALRASPSTGSSRKPPHLAESANWAQVPGFDQADEPDLFSAHSGEL